MKGQKVLLTTLLFLGGVDFIFRNVIALEQTKEITIVCDSRFSKNMQERLFLFAQEGKKLSLTPSLLAQVIKETFCSVDNVTVKTFHGKRCNVFVTSHVPVFRLNNKHVFLKTGGISDGTDFREEEIAQLPLISFDVKGKVKDYPLGAMQQWTKKITISLFEDYEVTWCDESYILFKDKNAKNISLIAEMNTDFTQELLQSCIAIKSKIMERKNSSAQAWFIDVRFKNQIVAFRQIGGKV